MSPAQFARATVYVVWLPNGRAYRDGNGNTRFNHKQAASIATVTGGRISGLVK
jgi:hypothetical protein